MEENLIKAEGQNVPRPVTTFEESARYFDIYPNKKSFPDDANAETIALVERDLAERKKS